MIDNTAILVVPTVEIVSINAGRFLVFCDLGVHRSHELPPMINCAFLSTQAKHVSVSALSVARAHIYPPSSTSG